MALRRQRKLLDTLPLNYEDNTLNKWLRGRSIVRAFEIEHTTAVYSGLLKTLLHQSGTIPTDTLPQMRAWFVGQQAPVRLQWRQTLEGRCLLAPSNSPAARSHLLQRTDLRAALRLVVLPRTNLASLTA